ncbi:MAG: FGGY-family carbohydrate kinase, partial [Bacilli bacterium]|nr:FGGY-family carbohydrate kinase [Bacilli bacterium]
LDFLEIKSEQLPRVLESSEVVGLLDAEISKELKIPQIKVIIGGGDQAMGAIGTGTVNDGDMNISLGTSGVVFVASDKYSVDKKSYLHSFAHANRKYHLMGVTLAAAGSFKWWKDKFLKEKTYDEIFAELLETKIDDSIYYLPYISGERSPINNPLAKGTFCGFTQVHKIENFSRAVIEGAVYSLRHCYEVIKSLNIKSEQIRITGGGSKNDHWCQMIADVFNIEVQKPQVTEGSSLGAAIMAMVGDGLFQDVFGACKEIIKVEKVFIPNVQNVAIYEKKYQCYLQLYEAVKPFFDIIGK